jgi:ribosomal protein S14
MSKEKKLIRSRFRNSVFNRDKHQCVTCGTSGVKSEALIVLCQEFSQENDGKN